MTAPEILLRGGRVLSVFTGELLAADVLGVGSDYRDAPRVWDLDGAVVLPGLFDAPVHIESSLLTPPRFTEAVAVRGTTTIVADPHEIANVLGLDGVRWMLHASRDLPVECLFTVPSCGPAAPFETAGARLGATDVGTILGWELVLGLGQVIDVPGVLAGAADLRRKIAIARASHRPVDGHAPRLTGPTLNTYVAASSD